MNVFIVIAYFLCVLICIRSISIIVKLLSNLRWLRATIKLQPTKVNQLPNFIISIPMLKEQRVIKDTLTYFSQLNYPKDKLLIYIVTTKKEKVLKEENAKRIPGLAKDIASGVDKNILLEKHLGLFSSADLLSLYEKYINTSYNLLLPKLEKEYIQYPTTYDLAVKYSKEINKKVKHKLVQVVEYPHTTGVVSHQINYLVKKLTSRKELQNAIFSIYNADSRPHKDTLQHVAKTFREFEEKTGRKANIVQQLSLLTLNYNHLPKNFSGYFLKAAALMQTKWMLTHECMRLRRQSKDVVKVNDSILSKLRFTHLSHCIGHGLFIRFSLISKDMLPLNTLTEDLAYGFLQCCKREPIVPLALLENSESPETIKMFINQKKTWFWPYLEYIKLRKITVEKIKNGSIKNSSIFEVNMLTTEALLTGLIWLLQTFIIFIPLIIGVLYLNTFLLLFWLLAIVCYWYIPVAAIYFSLHTLESYTGKIITQLSLKDFLYMSFAELGVLSIYSLGPIQTIVDAIEIKLGRKQLVRQKTER